MKLKDAIASMGASRATAVAAEYAEIAGVDWQGGARYVFAAIVADPERVPANIGGASDSARAAIEKWVLKYQRGYEGRASVRASNPPGTVADPVIEKIIAARLDGLSDEDLERITYAHRLAMSAENILGLILEEYLAVNLEGHGWHCAWGETVKSVDFVHENGALLQVKNRSNSENSSSSTVRAGTVIEKWFRIKADRIQYMWDELNEICGTSDLSEESFVAFVNATVSSNPDCLCMEEGNVWGSPS